MLKTAHELEVELQKLKPTVVILLEPCLPFMRVLEVSAASLGPLHLHLLVYKKSIEHFQFLQAAEEETRSLKALKEANLDELVLAPIEHDLEFFSQDQKLAKATKHILPVDTREFSSMTPVHLHLAGFWVVPMQLTVGDYILSDEICIERKSVATGDLFESFKSGRLL